MMKNMAVGTTSDVMYDATTEIETEKNWEMFRTGAPANLKMMEGLLSMQPDNKNLLAGLVKGYTGYAFGVDETLAMDDQFAGKSVSINRSLAIANYSKGLTYGLRYLSKEGVSLEELRSKVNEDGAVTKMLDSKLSSDSRDLEVVIFTAQALGALINLQKNDLSLVAQLPLVKGMFDWVCAKNPEINFGTCGVFEGAFQAGRPRALGGNPEKGKKVFLDTIKKYPDNALIRASFIQFYLLPLEDEEGYKEQARELEKGQEALWKASSWSPKGATPPADRMWLYRAIGLKRFEIIKKYEKKHF